MATTTPNYNGPSGRTEDMKSKASEQLGAVSDAVNDTVRDASRKVENMAGDLAQRGREVGDQVQDAAGNAKQAVDTSLRDHPMTTLAAAAVIGFVLGAIWKS